MILTSRQPTTMPDILSNSMNGMLITNILTTSRKWALGIDIGFSKILTQLSGHSGRILNSMMTLVRPLIGSLMRSMSRATLPISTKKSRSTSLMKSSRSWSRPQSLTQLKFKASRMPLYLEIMVSLILCKPGKTVMEQEKSPIGNSNLLVLSYRCHETPISLVMKNNTLIL